MVTDKQKQVLVVEDEPSQRHLVRRALETDFTVHEAANGREGLRLFYQHRPDLIVLDASMPEMDGWEMLRHIRDMADTPVIMLTGRDADPDVVRGLSGGADDYITKPFSPSILGARVEAVLRRTAGGAQPEAERLELYGGELVVDRSSAQVWVRGEEVHLTPIEYRLLTCLASHPGQVLTPSQILEQVWGPAYEAEASYVKGYVRLLRTKIEQDPHRPRYVLSRRGLGYMLPRTI